MFSDFLKAHHSLRMTNIGVKAAKVWMFQIQIFIGAINEFIKKLPWSTAVYGKRRLEDLKCFKINIEGLEKRQEFDS